MAVTVIGNKLQVEVLADESTKTQLNEVQQEVRDLDSRVDTILTTPVESVSAQEIIDARQGEASLGANITEVKSQLAESEKQLKGTTFNTAGTKIIAHRGASSYVPENTIPAFEKAGEMGFWGCETDISFTSDNIPIVMHDGTVDRTTNGTGNVVDMSLAQIQALIIDSGNNIEKYPNLKVPTLEDYLKVCKKWGMVALIELKHTLTTVQLELLQDIIASYGMTYNSILIAYGAILEGLEETDISIAVLASPSDGNISYALSLKKPMMSIALSLVNSDNVKKIHDNNMKVIAYTINTVNDFATCYNNGVDFIITDGAVLGYNNFGWGKLNFSLNRLIDDATNNPTTGSRDTTLPSGLYGYTGTLNGGLNGNGLLLVYPYRADGSSTSYITQMAIIGDANTAAGVWTRDYLGTTGTWTNWYKQCRFSYVPTTPTSAGAQGDIAANASYLYICYAPNAWRRVAVSTW